MIADKWKSAKTIYKMDFEMIENLIPRLIVLCHPSTSNKLWWWVSGLHYSLLCSSILDTAANAQFTGKRSNKDMVTFKKCKLWWRLLCGANAPWVKSSMLILTPLSAPNTKDRHLHGQITNLWAMQRSNTRVALFKALITLLLCCVYPPGLIQGRQGEDEC